MLNLLKFEKQVTDGEATIYKFTNPIRKHEIRYPAVLFDVESSEDVNAIKMYYFNNYPHNHIGGFVIPFNKLRDFSILKDMIPLDNTQLICSVPNELFFYGRLKEKIAKFYYNFSALPQHLRNEIVNIANTKNFYDKVKKHKHLWTNISADHSLLFKVINGFVTPQVNFDVTVLENVGPYLFDMEDVGINNICYDYGKKLFHTGNRDIENTGRILCYPAHVHKNFLSKKSNIDELIQSISESDARGIMFKLVDIDDIRERKDHIDNYNYLIRNMKELSESLQIPCFYLSTHTEGLVSLTRGINAFSQSFNHSNNIPREIKLNKNFMYEKWRTNPKFPSGQIYDYKTKEMVTRDEFEKMVENNNNVPNAPVGELANYSSEHIRGMSIPRFRQYSRMYFMAVRNLEVAEIHDAIKTRETVLMRNKFKFWIKDLTLFPK